MFKHICSNHIPNIHLTIYIFYENWMRNKERKKAIRWEKSVHSNIPHPAMSNIKTKNEISCLFEKWISLPHFWGLQLRCKPQGLDRNLIKQNQYYTLLPLVHAFLHTSILDWSIDLIYALAPQAQ